MASYDSTVSTVIGAADAERVSEAARERLQIPELPASELPAPVAWKVYVYAALAVVAVAFLLAVLLMAAGVVATPHM